jgi:hypothetical protein
VREDTTARPKVMENIIIITREREGKPLGR